MAVPTSYSEGALAQYMHTVLGAVATALGFDVSGGDYDEAVTETLFAYGVSAIASAADIQKLRALARREAWRLAMNETAGDFDFRADGGQYSRSQFHKQCKEAFESAELEALPYDTVRWAVEVGTVEDAYDPYAVPD